jgi:hypothetical protein
MGSGSENLAPLPPPGIDPRTFRPVAGRYTGYAFPAHTETSVIYFQ